MSTKLPDYHPETKLSIYPPYGKAKSFYIKYKEPGGVWTTLKLPEIDLANQLLKAGTVSEEHTHEKLKGILAAQYVHRDRKKKKAPFMQKNMELLEAMWKDKYNRRYQRDMKRPEDSRRELELAVEACGLFPLDTCDLEDLADHLDKNLDDDPNKHHRRITWVNSILQWLGRNKLQTVDRVRAKVKYLNEDEFKSILPHIKNRTKKGEIAKPENHVDAETVKLLARIAFYTGARLGEIFYIQTRHVKKNNVLHLELQMLDEWLEKEQIYKEDTLKNGHERDVFYPPIVEEDLRKWAKVPFKDRYEIRKKSFCKRITGACKKEFGESDPQMLLNFHDLRHCHAIWLLQKGASLIEVAQQLGNAPDVCYKYYSGFELKKESVERLKSLM